MQWDPTSQQSPNIKQRVMLICMGALDIILDLAVLCLPIPKILTLQTTTRRKWICAAVIWLGAL